MDPCPRNFGHQDRNSADNLADENSLENLVAYVVLRSKKTRFSPVMKPGGQDHRVMNSNE